MARSFDSWRNEVLVSLPAPRRSPLQELARRATGALLVLIAAIAMIYFDRDGYLDQVNGDGISLIDAIYYSTVTITTTGYGDIVPVTPMARLLNAIVVTPLRIGFLVLLVGTTLEVLANEGRAAIVDTRWRKHMRGHTVIVGYGTKGRSSVKTLLANGVSPDKIVVIDGEPESIVDANRAGFAAIEGDATRREILGRAEIRKAREVIVTMDRDDSAILVTLTTRQLNPNAHLVVAVNDEDNAPLVRQSGANVVVTSSDAVGRLLGLSTVSPKLGNVLEDILSSGQGLELAQRRVTAEEAGKSPADIHSERVISVVRSDVVRRYYDPAVQELHVGDEIIVVRRSAGDSRSRSQGL